MKIVLKKFLIFIYIIIAAFMTFYLFSYNEYGLIEMGKYTLINSENNENVENGQLVIAKKDIDGVKKKDEIFFYNTYGSKVTLDISKVNDIEEVNSFEKTFTLDEDMKISSTHLVGLVEDSINLSFLGYILGILSSELGYLVFVVFPIFFVLILQIINFRKTLKDGKNEV